MFYATKFQAALSKLSSIQSQAAQNAARSLPCSPSELAAVLATNGWKQWQEHGLSPMVGAICSIGSVIEKS